MKSWMLVPAASALLLTGCLVAPRPGGGLEMIPMLPAVVEIGPDAYVAHGGYHYFYANERWYYASSKNGERRELPRSHWPREVRRRSEERPR
jgi:hypothetical protein